MTDSTVNNSSCYCCGGNNERGLHLQFEHPDKETAVTRLTVPEYFSGWKNLTHGGFISLLLDEIMAHACLASGLTGVTAELTVRFRTPLPVGTEVIVSGKVEKQKSRIAVTSGELKDSNGTVYASANARFIRT